MATTRPMGCTSIHHHPATLFHPGFYVVDFVLASADMRATVPEDVGGVVEVRSLETTHRIRGGIGGLPVLLRGWIAESQKKELAT